MQLHPHATMKPVAKNTTQKKTIQRYVDPGWPVLADGVSAVTELSSSRSGGLSPFGEDVEFPLPADDVPYIHPHTVINR